MDLGSPSQLQRERRGEPAAAVGPRHGSGGGGEGISPPCSRSARSCRDGVAVGGRHACHAARPARGTAGTPPPMQPTLPGRRTCPPPRGTSARACLFPPALQAGGAASIFLRVQEGQRLFPMVLIRLRLPQIASRRETLRSPLRPAPWLAHSLAGMLPSWSDLFTHLLLPQHTDPGGLPSDLPSRTPVASCVCGKVLLIPCRHISAGGPNSPLNSGSTPPRAGLRSQWRRAGLLIWQHRLRLVPCSSPGMSRSPRRGVGTDGHGWEKGDRTDRVTKSTPAAPRLLCGC